MSTINDPSTQPVTQVTFTRSAKRLSIGKVLYPSNSLFPDSVEISAAARQMAGLDETQTGSMLSSEKKLAIGSKDHEAFQDLMDKVKRSKSELTSRIKSVLDSKSISLVDRDALKIEVGKNGKIVVGGISDAQTARRVEKALNGENGLADAILAYQKDEKQLSAQTKEYTGCSLYELTSTTMGKVNERIRSEVESSVNSKLNTEFYTNFGFLGDDEEIINRFDAEQLAFTSGIDFSAEVNVMSDPEGNLKSCMNDLAGSIKEEFASLNDKIVKRFEAQGVKLDKGTREQLLLDLKKVQISVNSDGDITINGTLSSDEETNAKGIALIEKLAYAMLTDTSNSYHVNIFSAASQSLLQRHAEQNGGDKYDLVVTELTAGNRVNIRTTESQNKNSKYTDTKDVLFRSQARVLRS